MAPARPNDQWDPMKLQEKANTSGKPFEIACALKLIESNNAAHGSGGPEWTIDLGSYYLDPTMGKTRELDVMATKMFVGSKGATRLRTFLKLTISCKGFAPGAGPITFSVPRGIQSSALAPCLLNGRSDVGGADVGFGQNAAASLLKTLGLWDGADSKAIVGYDVYKEQGAPSCPEYSNMRQEEHDMFEYGIDSAVKAAVFWHRLRFPGELSCGGAILPIFVTKTGWWDFDISAGTAAIPVTRHKGFLVNTYPISDRKEAPVSLISLICSEQAFGDIVSGIDTFFTEYAINFPAPPLSEQEIRRLDFGR